MVDLSPDLFMGRRPRYQQSELGLFSEIANGKNTAESLAQATGAGVRGMRILCDYLTVHGHLEMQGERYGLIPSTQAFWTEARQWMGGIGLANNAADRSDLGEGCAGNGPVQGPLGAVRCIDAAIGRRKSIAVGPTAAGNWAQAALPSASDRPSAIFSNAFLLMS
jgi:hypothetical protein